MVVFYATGSAFSGGPKVVEREDKAGLIGKPVPRLKAFIGKRDFQRRGKVIASSKNFVSY